MAVGDAARFSIELSKIAHALEETEHEARYAELYRSIVVQRRPSSGDSAQQASGLASRLDTSTGRVDGVLYFFRENRRSFLASAAAFFRSSATTVGKTRRRAASACVSSGSMFRPVTLSRRNSSKSSRVTSSTLRTVTTQSMPIRSLASRRCSARTRIAAPSMLLTSSSTIQVLGRNGVPSTSRAS
jgi:hypothetical protein